MIKKEVLQTSCHLDDDTFKEFEDIYKDHCANILDAVISINFTRSVWEQCDEMLVQNLAHF